MIKAPLNLAMLGDPQAAQYCDMLGLATTFAPLADPECSTAVTPLFHDDLTDLALDASGTFTRASTAYHQQPDGIWRAVLSGEARMSGARRVRNLATSLTTQTITVVNGNKYQVAIKGTNGTTAVCSGAFTGTLTADGTNYISWASGTPKTSGSTSLTVTVTGTLTQLMVEDVTVQANQNPSSWVDGSTSHGAAVNGVRYLKTANGNTVDGSGIVTEATGAALSGPFGLLVEPAATNGCLQSSALTSYTGFQSSCAASGTLLALPAFKFFYSTVGSATPAIYKVDMSLGALGDTITTWCYAKADGYNGFVLAAVNAVGYGAAFDLSTGQVHSVGANVIAAQIVDMGNGIYRCAASAIATDGTQDIRLYTGPTSSITNGTFSSFTTTANAGTIVAAPQMFVGTIAEISSPILTTTAPVSRAVDALSYSGIPADNEARLVIDGANVDIDDWDGTVSTPTVPEVLSDVIVYAPGERPA